MPRSCCVPGCKSNYKSADASAFSFPKDEQRRQQWMRAIHRKDFTPTENTIVCSKHFQKRFIITEDSMTRADGTVVTAKRGRPSLHKDACPTIFENQPKYMSKEIPAPRTTPQERRDKLIERDEMVFSDWIEKDQINSFKEFCEGFTEKLSKGKRQVDSLSPDFAPSLFNHTSRPERKRRIKTAEDSEREKEIKIKRLESESRIPAAKVFVSLPEDSGIQRQHSEPCWHYTSPQERQRMLTEVASSERKETTKGCVKAEDETAAAKDVVRSHVMSVKGSDIVKEEKNLADDGFDYDSCITVKYESIDDSPSESFENVVVSGYVIRNVTLENQIQSADPQKTDSSTMTHMHAKYITSLEQECQALRIKCFELEEKRKKLLLAEEGFKGNDAKVKYFTGLPTFGVLMDTFSLISDHLEDQPRLTKFQQYILTLVRLKHNSSMLDLSYRFDVYAPTISKVFQKVLGVCMTKLVPARVSWPKRQPIDCNFPVAFVNDFPNCVAIINCFEIDIGHVPAGREEKSEACTNSKPSTMKYLIAVSPQGSLLYISKGWIGTYSNMHVAENCGILDKLGPEDEILADKGFNTSTCISLYGTALTEGKKEMVKVKVGKTKMSAEVQSYVGKVMGPAYSARRKYAMLQSIIPNSMLKKVADTDFTILDQVVCVACALTSVDAAAAEI